MAALRTLFGKISERITHTMGPIDIANAAIKIRIPIRLTIPSEEEIVGNPAEFTLE